MADKTNRLNIYLFKDDPEIARYVQEGWEAIELSDGSQFYGKDSFVGVPDWVSDFFGNELDGKFNFKKTSSRGLLVKQATWGEHTRTFAVAFGGGRFFLEEGVLEERFGMKVVLNSVARDSLRSIDRTVLGSSPKQSREQVSRESEAASFGIDIEQDLLNGVTGRSKDARLGKTVSGRDALSLSIKVDFPSLDALLEVCLEKYMSEAYETDFKWIDQIRDVRNPNRILELNKWLVDRLAANELDYIWMAPPVVIDWVKLKGFKYGAPKRGDLHADLEVAEFLASLGDKPVTLEVLKGRLVHAIAVEDDEPFDHWSAYRCIYAEAPLDGKVCILNNGKWYEIAVDFTEEVQADFIAMPESTLDLPDYHHESEGAYNAAAAAGLPGSVCLDADNIVHGGGHSRIEFCDIFTADNQFAHIKRYSGSAQLSHLFNQGVVAGELFASDAAFRAKVNAKLPDARKFEDTDARPPIQNYEVTFGIIMPPGREFDIPFFSKVGLRNAHRRLRGYGYTVTKKGIRSTAEAPEDAAKEA
ncbi:TIGR04141 family sporadically distributed protein [Mycoplana sp. MJR14]|uniref:TIGR04141 family sporadically distributed protein n=1 Tax=Mycoplana sp. MJR14 TaxID=3032583 RepID=UPI0023DAA6BA|nr:TIGR04141 family sporadically distributed protein [Mycoplana sp. MJR14]MDF1631270.1 TIGR04141 family sporadically distributed protein [Mycoplana sp. MJR14]